MKKKLGLISVFMIFVLCTLVLFGCGKEDAPESEEIIEPALETETVTQVTELVEEETPEPDQKGPVLSPESAVAILMKHKSVWMLKEELFVSPLGGYAYCLLDLDFDGTLELICNLTDGSGRFSDNKIYRIDIEEQTLEEIEQKETESGFDYYLFAEEAVLVKNKESGKKHYLFKDFVRASAADGYITFSEAYVENGKLYEEFLSSESWLNDTDPRTYYFGKEKLSEKEYLEKYNEYYKKNKDLKLSWKCVDGLEFDKAEKQEQEKMLLTAYKNFSYDGFSFSKIETYDVELKEEKAEVQVGKYYYSTVKDNFAKGYEPKLILNADGTFVFDENLAAGMGSYRGTYQVLWGHLQLLVTEVDFSGFAGDDVKVIDFIITDSDTLTLNTELCLSFGGDRFSTTAP